MSITETYKTGVASEHSYRPAIQRLIDSISDEVHAINEPARVKCGAPDFIVNLGDVPVGHIEAKDIDLDITTFKGANLDQFKRYTAALPNLIYTNGLDWEFYRDGNKVASVSIGDFLMGIQPKPERFETLEVLLTEFIKQRPQSIDSPRDLAERMAGKAQLIKNILGNTLREDKGKQSELANQYEAFKENLIHDISLEDFADIYAETIAYGMFAARLHDTTLSTFSRQEALELLPKTNPFLRSLFTYVAGYDLDDRIAWIIDDLALVFQACNVAALMRGFGKLTGQQDPFLHFYETFLAAYNPAKRKARGVWYTPEPVVNFIVRAVDEVLLTEFGLSDGLADTSKVSIDWETGQTDKKGRPVRIKKDVHRVQILDPATGTGTFLAEVIKQIAPKVKNVAPGMWSQYIEQDLIPRLHGFEILMASYAMCHMKLDMILTELGYAPATEPPRLSIYLTNSLEEGEPANQTLPFSQWLSREAKGANTIKRDMPIMCVIGNPPYLGEGGISEGWIGALMNDYKKEPGGKERLKERNPKWLNDLYVKFIRLSSHLIEKNGEGVLGFITNHGYLDNPTFRGMRWHLLKTFDRIWVLDLHGNAKKGEVPPEGGKDKNVFDIQQGVSIIIAVKKTNTNGEPAQVKHGDVWGQRAHKHSVLQSENLESEIFKTLECPSPQYPFVPRDLKGSAEYQDGFQIRDFFLETTTGMQTGADRLLVSENRQELAETLSKDTGSVNEVNKYIVPMSYRPFDNRWVYYSSSRSSNPLNYINLPESYRPRSDAILNLSKQNPAILFPRRLAGLNFHHVFIADRLPEMCVISNKTREQNVAAPLYLLPTAQDLDQTRRINFDPKLHSRLQQEAEHSKFGIPNELQIFDYIYGVLHYPAYRETYAEFLKIDFPRIPWPKTPDDFWAVSEKGAALRKLHLMEPDAIGDAPYPFKGEGDNVVDKPELKDGKIWINKDQCFEGVPEISWGFYIGGYQPAQKWLKDRKGRELSFDEVKHYQKIVKILAETDRIMKTIEMEL